MQHKPATTCSQRTPIAQVARLMQKDNVGSVVVTDEHGRLAGIVTDRDILIRGVAANVGGGAPVETVMTRNVVYLYDEADAFTAAAEMAEKGLRRLPVLDAQGHLTGVVSFDDLVVAFSDQMERLARAVRKEILAAPKS